MTVFIRATVRAWFSHCSGAVGIIPEVNKFKNTSGFYPELMEFNEKKCKGEVERASE